MDDAKKLLARAKKCFEDKEYDKAKELLEQLLPLDNPDIKKDVYFYLGQVYDIGRKDYLTAIEYYKKLFKYPLNEKEENKLYYLIGELYRLRTDYLDSEKDKEKIKSMEKKAIYYFNKIINSPNKDYHIKSLIQLSGCYYLLGNYREAIKTLKELEEIKIPLEKKMENKYGKENVSIENPHHGNRIDVVVRNGENYIFYEIKVASSVKTCIRQAIGQLFEYAFWPDKRSASKIVVVGEYPIGEEGKRYIEFLKNEFEIPIEYLYVEID